MSTCQYIRKEFAVWSRFCHRQWTAGSSCTATGSPAESGIPMIWDQNGIKIDRESASGCDKIGH
jgi:hypothetical protein